MKSISLKLKVYFLVLVGIILLFFIIEKIYLNSISKDKIVTHFEKTFSNNEKVLRENVKQIHSLISSDTVNLWNSSLSDLKNKDISVFIFVNNKPVFWNTNEIYPEKYLLPKELNQSGVEKLGLGWYQYFLGEYDNVKIILLKEIYKDYPVSNKYLKDYYNKEYFLTKSILLNKNPRLSNISIYSKNGDYLVSLIIKNNKTFNNNATNVLSVFYVLIYLFTLLLILELFSTKPFEKINSYIKFLLFSVLTLLFYVLFCFVLLPDYLSESYLFDFRLSVGYLIVSRGTALIYSISILFVSYTYYSLFKDDKKHLKSFTYFLIQSITIYFLSIYLLTMFKELYIRTIQSGDVAIGFIFRYNFINLVLTLSISLSLAILLLAFAKKISEKRNLILFNFIITSILTFVLIILFPEDKIIWLTAFLLQAFIPVIFLYTPVKHNIAFLRFLLLLVLFSLGFTLIINDNYLKFRNKDQKEIVKKLTTTIDNELINKFNKLKKAVDNDIIIKNMLLDSINDYELTDYLEDDYLRNMFYEYDVQVTLCRKGYMLEIQPSGKIFGCSKVFENLMKRGKYINSDSSLLLMENESESNYYLGEIKLKKDSLFDDRLYIEFFSSMVPTDLGYPEVMQDKNKDIDLLLYSLAKFQDGELIYQYGDFDYHSDYSFFDDFNDSSFFIKDGYVHYKISLDDNKSLVVSRKTFNFTERIGTFSILFILFSILGLIVYLIYYGKDTIRYLKYSFRARLQILFVLTILIIFITLASVTLYYFINLKQTIIKNQLNEKTKSVLTELQYNYGTKNLPNSFDDNLEEVLKELSLVFFTDINIYGVDGNLIASSRPEIFEEGFLSKIINPQGYKSIIIDDKLILINVEHIGKLNYYSSYVPLIIEDLGFTGVLNLPYFTRQSKIKETFFTILFSYLNLFVLIGILGTFIAILVARFLTKPLSLLQKRLSELRLDTRNEPLEWAHDDEIGKLIEEYNRMVKKLIDSAELLKRSERESAWRELAQQIAHEIRNPLTPMKLNVQYLQKTYRNDKAKFEKKFSTLTDSIINQIEALNEVASMFSELAKGTGADVKKVNLISLLKSAVLLYNNTSGVKVTFETNLDSAFILAREPELLRVFNNIIKNAIQAVNDTDGAVFVKLFDAGKFYEVRIIDTGKGIDDEMKKKIFLPYFTTKTGGTGIGLAIVKKIIMEIGGEITFESEEGKGTVFKIMLKKL